MKAILKTLSAIMFLVPLLLAAESKTGYVHGDHTHDTVTFSTEYATFYMINASPQNGWEFATQYFSLSGYNGWHKEGISKTSASAKCERIFVNDVEIASVWIDAATAFSVTIGGKMYKPGGSGGSLVNWSVTGNGSNAVITMHLDPTEAIIALGDSKGFTYKKADGVALYGLWWDSSKTPSFDTGNYSAIGSTYNFSSTTAGQYTLTAARNGAGHKSASATVKNVEVVSVSCGSITSTTDSPGANETIYIGKGSNSIDITATPKPAGTWPDNYPVWNDDGYFCVDAGNGVYSFNPTTTGLYTIAAHCGMSHSKALKIGVCEITKIEHKNPSENESYFEIQDDEIIFSGITFDYKAVMSHSIANENDFDWDIWEYDYINSLLATGTSLTANTSISGAYDSCDITFYNDANNNGIRDTGEYYKTSNTFSTVNQNTVSLSVRYSTDIGTLSETTVASKFSAAASICRKKDHAVDFRANVIFNISSFSSFIPDYQTNPDPCHKDDINIHFAQSNFTFVNDLYPGNERGWGKVGSRKAIVEWHASYPLANIIAHELGHNAGLYHRNDLIGDYVMFGSGVSTSSNVLALEEAQAYTNDL